MSKFARDLDFIQFHLRVLNESQSPVLISSTLLDSIVVPFLRDLPFSLKRPITDWAKNTAQQQRQQILFTLSFLVSVSLLLQPDRTPNKLDIFVPQKLLVLVVFLHSPPDHRRRFCNFPLRQRKSTQKRARRNYDFNDLHFNYHSMQFAGKTNYEQSAKRVLSPRDHNTLWWLKGNFQCCKLFEAWWSFAWNIDSWKRVNTVIEKLLFKGICPDSDKKGSRVKLSP